MLKFRKAPRWTVAFLRALKRTGDVRAASLDAGIDHTTAYLRRRSHADFADAWDEALRAFESGQARIEEEQLEAVRSVGAELLATTALGGAQVKRVHEGRWTPAREKRFFDELAGTANVKRSADAAGVSTAAVYARRMKQPLFRAKWEAVLETGRAAIEMKLVEAANKTFDPDLDLGDLDLGNVQPKVSVAEAIRIVQLHGSKAERQSIEELDPPEEEVSELRARILRKFQRLRERDMPKWLAEGWSHDERHGHMVPPGWVRA
jgi:hypothetical protein